MSRANGSVADAQSIRSAMTSLSVSGFKSIVEERTLEIRPLTLLAGANSSGKSSMMQPLLLMKQTMDAQFDPGPLLLNGPNVKFTSVNQFWPAITPRKASDEFSVKIGITTGADIEFNYQWSKKNKRLQLTSNIYGFQSGRYPLTENTKLDEFIKFLDLEAGHHSVGQLKEYTKLFEMDVRRVGPFLEMGFLPGQDTRDSYPTDFASLTPFSPRNPRFGEIVQSITGAIHLPGLRGNPERVYPVASIGPRFRGTFESYAASMVSSWAMDSPNNVDELSEDLKSLGLTWKVEATPIDDTQVELRVGRLPRPRQGGARDLVNIADVGLGVSQTLPVVVALRAAQPGQLVYIEQPEIHLHPRAQVAMARLLVNAANRGVRVVAETHSSLILLAVQTLVAEGVIEPSLVGLNWFLRDEKDGTTRIQTAELDEAGRFGDWPEDFDEVALEAESRYLSAAESRLSKG